MVSSADLDAVVQGRPQSRLQTFRELLRGPGAHAQRLPEVAPLFPFRLGEGPRDWALPYAFDDRIVSLGAHVVDELFTLFAERRQPAGDVSLPLRYGLRRGVQPWAIRLAAAASELDPNLDPALISAWCDRSAGPLGDELAGAFTRAFDAEMLGNGQPPWAMLLSLAVPALVDSLKARVKARTIRGMGYERLEKAVGLALFALVELSAQRAMRELERRPHPRDHRPLCDRVRLCLNPLRYCAIRSRALQNGLNPWWSSDEINEIWAARRADELLSRPVDQLLQSAVDQLLSDPQNRAAHAKAGRASRVRYELLRLLWDYDRGPDEPWGTLRAALAHDERLEELQREARPVLQRIQHAGVSPKALGALQTVLSGGGQDHEDLRIAVSSQIAFGIDRVLAEHCDRLSKCLRDARAEGDVRQLIQLYEQGRLYRFSADAKPTLQEALRREAGHLFVDLKGFTQRTVRAKEIVVADFLRREFYEPILRAAGAVAQSGGEVKLMNLVGDAAVFSGDVPALVHLAGDIRGLCNAYQKTLAGADPAAAASEDERHRLEIEGRLAALEEPLLLEASLLDGEIARKQAMTVTEREAELARQLQARASEVARAHAEIRSRLSMAQAAERPPLEAEMLRLSEAQEALAETARVTLERLAPAAPKLRADAIFDLITGRERARLEELVRTVKQAREQAGREVAQRRRLQRTAQGGGLEAGVFVSFGAAAEEIQIQDPVFGEVRVAVAEKLNEAARGTGRSSKVAEEVAEALRAAMVRSGNSQLRDPFSVHVGGGDEQVATDIFNVGEALSGEALHVFLQQTLGQRFHFERPVRRSELSPEITEQLAMPERFRLIVSVSTQGPLTDSILFRRAGFVVFRGFEEGEGCEVFEMMSSEHRVTRLLAQHHLAAWVEEAKKTPKQLITGLPGK